MSVWVEINHVARARKYGYVLIQPGASYTVLYCFSIVAT